MVDASVVIVIYLLAALLLTPVPGSALAQTNAPGNSQGPDAEVGPIRAITTTPQGNGEELVGTVHLLPGEGHAYRAVAAGAKPEDLAECASDDIKVHILSSRQRPVRGILSTRLILRVETDPDTPLGTYYAPVAISHYKDRKGRQVTGYGELRIVVTDHLPGRHRILAKWIRAGLGGLMIVILGVVFLGMIGYILLRVVLGVRRSEIPEVEDAEEEDEDIDEELIQEALSATLDESESEEP